MGLPPVIIPLCCGMFHETNHPRGWDDAGASLHGAGASDTRDLGGVSWHLRLKHRGFAMKYGRIQKGNYGEIYGDVCLGNLWTSLWKFVCFAFHLVNETTEGQARWWSLFLFYRN